MSKKGDLKKALIGEFFTSEKKAGIREGFRRLAIYIGTAAFLITFESTRDWPVFVKDFYGMPASVLSIAIVVFFSFVTFFVVAFIVKSIGWVIEGFTGK